MEMEGFDLSKRIEFESLCEFRLKFGLGLGWFGFIDMFGVGFVGWVWDFGLGFGLGVWV